jgi:bacillithiol biosynthesis cysteine-adding enzyme BshC
MPMNITKVPLLNTGYFSGLTKAYIANDANLKAFYNHYFDIENFEKAIEERKKFEVNRVHLFEVLHEQHSPFYKDLPTLAGTVASIKENNTFTITTGHQICLATGPLYFIYKIASAINLCGKLKATYPQYNFVPVYWMATEDHDFEEINHLHLFSKKIVWDIASEGATGRISTKEINPFLNELKAVLGDKVNDINYFQDVLNAYQNNTNLADATRALVLHLFGDRGLLVIDADHNTLKQDFKEIIKKDILHQISFKEVTHTIKNLVETNIIKEEKIQVKPRAINFFYLKDKLRKRISLEEHTYKVLDTDITFTEAQLLQEIDEFPERFSPNVIMRPVYQEYILPNLVYIGGAGELSYWFELKGVFDAHEFFFPMLALRNSFLWIDQKQADKLKQFDIQINEIFKPIEQLSEQVLKVIGFKEPSLSKDKELANQLFESMKENIISIDQTLVNSVEGERQKLIKSIEVLEQKLIKAQKLKHETSLNQIKKIKEQLFPEGGLQERFDNILWLNLKFGKEVINQIIELAHVESMEFTIVSE